MAEQINLPVRRGTPIELGDWSTRSTVRCMPQGWGWPLRSRAVPRALFRRGEKHFNKVTHRMKEWIGSSLMINGQYKWSIRAISNEKQKRDDD
jgi:hypothetical protein